jgi:hypothetical protein
MYSAAAQVDNSGLKNLAFQLSSGTLGAMRIMRQPAGAGGLGFRP